MAERQLLASADVTISAGLTDAEVERAESVVGARFPPDLRTFLAEGLPLGKGFPDWRNPDSSTVREQLDWPFEGIAFDITHSAFWLDAWGVRPERLDDALEIARTNMAAAPRLIPIFGHRYIPAEPSLPGNPIFSVYQTDIICYGTDLATYLRCEFHHLPYAEAVAHPPRTIPFWTDLVAANV